MAVCVGTRRRCRLFSSCVLGESGRLDGTDRVHVFLTVRSKLLLLQTTIFSAVIYSNSSEIGKAVSDLHYKCVVFISTARLFVLELCHYNASLCYRFEDLKSRRIKGLSRIHMNVRGWLKGTQRPSISRDCSVQLFILLVSVPVQILRTCQNYLQTILPKLDSSSLSFPPKKS